MLRVWELTSGKEVGNLDLGEDLKVVTGPNVAISSVAISPDGRLLLTAHGKTVRVRELATGKELHSYTIAAQEVRSMAFSPDSRFAAVGTSRSWVHLLRMPESPQVPKP
jgi:WD40 repeat protein